MALTMGFFKMIKQVERKGFTLGKEKLLKII